MYYIERSRYKYAIYFVQMFNVQCIKKNIRFRDDIYIFLFGVLTICVSSA